MRYERMNVCKECREYGLNCEDGKRCLSVKRKLRPYSGIRLTSDGFDCAMPVSLDSHSVCAYECLYCFSDNIMGHVTSAKDEEHRAVGQASLGALENILKDRDMKSEANWRFKKALHYDSRNAGGYPGPMQMGGLCDPCDSIEQNQGWLLEAIDLCIKYEQPLRLSTKGGALLLPDYIERMRKAPHLFWVAFSIITDDDDLLAKVDRRTATATQRLEAMKKMSDLGVNTSLRFRPMIPGISDLRYKQLIEKSAKAGARAVSYEAMFYPMAIPNVNKWKWKLLEEYTGHRLRDLYRSFGEPQACMRPPYSWTEGIMHAVAEEAHKHGMTCGVSDPVWKQLSDVGCCCGIPPDDPVFGNWERENATAAMVTAKRGGPGTKIFLRDIVPPWARETSYVGIVNPGVGPSCVAQYKHWTWADYLAELWNNPSKQRSPLNYFQGAWRVVDGEKDPDGNLVYEYVGLKRAHRKTHWKI